MIRKSLLSLLGALWAGAASADWGLNMPKGVTELSAETYDLHMMVFWWCVAIGVVVFGVMIISLFKHRKSKGAKPASFSHSTAAEVIWTIIPVLILLVMAVPILDVAWQIVDRLRRGQNPLQGDRGHLHFRLSDGGLPTQWIVIGYYLVAIAFGLVAIFAPSGLFKLLLLLTITAVVFLLLIWLSRRPLNEVESP